MNKGQASEEVDLNPFRIKTVTDCGAFTVIHVQHILEVLRAGTFRLKSRNGFKVLFLSA
jgi:hypothetical protein